MQRLNDVKKINANIQTQINTDVERAAPANQAPRPGLRLRVGEAPLLRVGVGHPLLHGAGAAREK